jgi:hypothetical protein
VPALTEPGHLVPAAVTMARVNVAAAVKPRLTGMTAAWCPLGFLTARDMTSAAGWVCQEREKPCPPALGYPDAEPMTAGRA